MIQQQQQQQKETTFMMMSKVTVYKWMNISICKILIPTHTSSHTCHSLLSPFYCVSNFVFFLLKEMHWNASCWNNENEKNKYRKNPRDSFCCCFIQVQCIYVFTRKNSMSCLRTEVVLYELHICIVVNLLVIMRVVIVILYHTSIFHFICTYNFCMRCWKKVFQIFLLLTF